MSDIRLVWDNDSRVADLALLDNDLESDDGLETAVLISLFTDRAASAGDVLPPGETDRRGWWADAVASVEGDKIGSRLWLLRRAKETPDILDRAEEYASEALAWLKEDKVADQVKVTASFFQRGALGLVVTISRPKVDPVTFRYQRVWESQARA